MGTVATQAHQNGSKKSATRPQKHKDDPKHLSLHGTIVTSQIPNGGVSVPTGSELTSTGCLRRSATLHRDLASCD